MRPNEKNEEKECGQTKNKPKQYAAERKKRNNMQPNEKNETICSQTKKRRKRIVQKPSKNVVIYSNTDENKN